MTSRSIREALHVQLLDTERMLSIVGNHPIMSFSLTQRANELRQQLEAIPLDKREAKVILFFSGKPVKGSQGIDAGFAGKVLPPFQSMVKTDFAQRINGKLGERGPAKNTNESQLFITALPRGSFGIELSKLQNQSLFDESELADTLVHLTNLIEASAKSDEDFAVALDDAPGRTIKSLEEFLKVISDEEAGVTIESGGIRCELSPERARIAYDRVSVTKTDDTIVYISGTLRGIMLDSWRFDFISADSNKFSGRLSEDLSEQDVKNFLQFIDQPCVGCFEESIVIFKNGQERIRYKLLSIQGGAQPSTQLAVQQIP
jgi:hypothetical protein